MKRILLAASAGLMFVGQATARTSLYDWVQVDGGTRSNTNVYAGLNWQWGGSVVPDIVVGVFSTRVKPNRDLTGGNISIQFNLQDGVRAPRVKLDYLNGRDDLQASLGAGLDFKKSAAFVGFGANAPYVNVGTDYSFDGKFLPYFGIHSQGKFKKNNSEIQCQNVGNGKYNSSDYAPEL